MAQAKGGLGSIGATVSSLLSRLPFAKPQNAPEPFSSVEDETPLGDLLAGENAAPQLKKKAERSDLKEIFVGLIKKPAVLIASLSGVGFVLIIALVAIFVSSPPAEAKAPPPFTKEGQALVKTWLLPPGDALEARMEMRRGDAEPYTEADAAKLGLPSDPLVKASLAERNDAAIEDLYGTVP
jgi:hypothetical protein